MNKDLCMSPRRTLLVARLWRGFTLVEVMVVVAIIGILASVAIPSYQDYVRRGQLPDAFASLADYRVKMEQYYQDNRRYGTAACADGADAPAWKSFKPSGSGYFTFACELSGTQAYKLTATGAKGAAKGHVYTLNQDNAKATTSFKGESSTKACWLLKGDEC
jgi:type IV pilus assembly protein PilE